MIFFVAVLNVVVVVVCPVLSNTKSSRIIPVRNRATGGMPYYIQPHASALIEGDVLLPFATPNLSIFERGGR